MNTKRDYQTIADNLSKSGFFTEHAHADVLHIIKSGGNRGLWLSFVENTWFIGTYIQVAYEIPHRQDIEQICLECLNAKEPLSRILPPNVVEKFSLQLLSKEEHKNYVGRVRAPTLRHRRAARDGYRMYRRPEVDGSTGE